MIFVLMEEAMLGWLRSQHVCLSYGARLTSHDADTVNTLLCTG